MRTFLLYVLTAVAEIVGCYLFLLFSNRPARWWLLPVALVVLSAFAWLLRCTQQHPAASTPRTAVSTSPPP
jgi:small multidrug resistance family-3 protein